MEKIFLSHRFTGENPRHLEDVLGNICSRLGTAGHDVFCSFFLEDYFRERGMSSEEIYGYCLKEQESCSIFMPLIKSEHPSYGMGLELDKALELGQRVVLLIRNDLGFPEFRSAAHNVVGYNDLSQLYLELDKASFL